MGVTALLGRLRPLVDTPTALRRWAWATLIANVGLVVTGGAVRLTGSGLGCPTWPRCTEESFRPHGAMDLHAAIEFGNRTLTFVLVAIAIGTFLAARESARVDLTRLSFGIALGIPAQAVIGGITVLTDLNPWIVSFHLMCSMVIIALAVLLLRRLPARGRPTRRTPLTTLADLTYAATWVVLYVGTIVTGSGPHAGDVDSPRNGLDPLQISQVHADVVFLLLGLTVGLLLAATYAEARETTRATRVLLLVLLAQGVLGFVQYFTDLPEVLVGLHMLGAAVIAAVATWAWLSARDEATGPASDEAREERTGEAVPLG